MEKGKQGIASVAFCDVGGGGVASADSGDSKSAREAHGNQCPFAGSEHPTN